MPTSSQARTADFIIIGGGVIGSAIAYALTRRSQGRVVLLERGGVAQANTSRSAGLLLRFRARTAIVPLIEETYRMIEEIEMQLKDSLGAHRVGAIHAAISPQACQALEKLAAEIKDFNIHPAWLDASDLKRLVPWMRLEDGGMAVYSDSDCYIDPYRLGSGYARAAKLNGAEIHEGEAVVEVLQKSRRVVGVRTAQGTYSAAATIDAAGAWAGLLAAQAGCTIPMAPVRSHYIITAPAAEIPPVQPMTFLPEARVYTRPELGGLLIGLREYESVAVDPRQVPENMEGYRFPRDPQGWESLEELAPLIKRFFPAIENIQIAHYIAGFSTFTPDGMFNLGGFPGVEGFYAAAGCSGSGVAGSGGIARATAELALGEKPFTDLSPFRMDRFGAVDPLDEAFQKLCAAARSRKTSG